MTWRETHPAIGTTSIQFSGTEPPKALVGVAWALIVLGVGYELFLNVLFPDAPVRGSKLAMQLFPLVLIALGTALAYKWRIGGPSSSVIEIAPAGLRFSRGFWLNPLVVPPAQVREMGVADHAQNYKVERYDAWGVPEGYSETARWFQVVLVTSAGERHVVACFGENACAVFYARRVLELLRDLGR